MRLDKFLCEMNIGSRSRIKTAVRQGTVTVNGCAATDPGQQIDVFSDRIAFRGKVLSYKKYVYYMLNKPPGTVSATIDNTAPTVVSLLGEDAREDIFPVGRLDKNAEGLLLLTNNGELAHRLLAPGRHVDKSYLLEVVRPLSDADKENLERGVDIGEAKPTLPARAEILSSRTVLLTIHEGKFHQVKRMLQALDNEVLALKRTAFGGLTLDEDLKPGQYRELSEEEISHLYRAAQMERHPK